jgi:hypothetical protein
MLLLNNSQECAMVIQRTVQSVNGGAFLVDALLEFDASRKCEDTLLQRAPKEWADNN